MQAFVRGREWWGRHSDTGHCPQPQHSERRGDTGTWAACSGLLQKLLFELVGGVRSLAG